MAGGEVRGSRAEGGHGCALSRRERARSSSSRADLGSARYSSWRGSNGYPTGRVGRSRNCCGCRWPRGLYEILLTEALDARLARLDPRHLPSLGALPDADAADRIAQHVAQALERAVSALPEGERAQRGARLAHDLVEILAAFGMGEGARVFSWQTGVYWAQHARADLFAFTLDKSAGSFSPNTRYRDYAVGPSVIHWESQSVARAGSPTGLRYQQHEKQGSDVMLFGRQSTAERAFHFRGPATYIDH